MQISPESLIEKAIQANVNIETLERLLAMRKDLKAEQAKEAFVRAMAGFQAECPIIEKKKQVLDKYGKLRYIYAPLDSIVSQVKAPLAKHGLSYDFDEIKDEKFVSAICTITHIMGHSKSSTFKVEIGKEEYMTDVQKYGARMTFAKRYAFCNALGILTGDEDTDANEDEDTGAGETGLNAQAPKNLKSKILDNLQKLGVFSKDPVVIVSAIKQFTGIDKTSDDDAVLQSINNLLEMRISETHENTII